MMTSEDVLKRVQDEIGQAETIDFDTPALYFDGKRPVPPQAEPGEPPWPDWVSREVQNAVVATLAEIMPGFFGDQPVEFLPFGAGDEKQAEQETQTVTHVLWSVCRAYHPVMRAMQLSLVYGFSALEVDWDSRVDIRSERVEGVPGEVLPLLAQQHDIAGVEPEGGLPAQTCQPAQTGESSDAAPACADRAETYAVDVRTVKPRNRPVVDWVRPGELIVGSGLSDASLDDARFVARRRTVSRSDLVSWGFPREVIEQIPDDSGNVEASAPEGVEWASEEVRVCVCYVLIDQDGDGYAERRRLITAGGTDGDQIIIDNRPVPTQPYVLVVPYFSLGDWRGVGLFDRLRSIQDMKTELMRQLLESGWRNLLQRTWGVERAYNANDLAASRRGGHVRVTDPAAIGVLPDVPVSPISFQLLGQVDIVRRESGGGAVDTAAQIQQLGGDTAHGVERLASAIEQTNGLVARNLAETMMRPLYLKLHGLLRDHWSGGVEFKQGGQWQQQEPQKWQERDGVAVSVGLSTADRSAYAANVLQVLQQQIAAMERGQDGVLVDLPRVHNALLDFARMMGLPAPDQYWLDPKSPEAQQAQQQKQQQAQEAKEEAKQAAQMQAQIMLAIEQIRADVERYKSDWDHQKAVNDQTLKLVELAAKYPAEAISDLADFQAAVVPPQGAP